MSRAEAQAKIKELNTLAAEELKGAGGVQLIDLTNPIESELESRFANWSTGRSPMLNREQSDLVAEKLAETLGVALPKYEDE
jgi:hypothetical protein